MKASHRRSAVAPAATRGAASAEGDIKGFLGYLKDRGIDFTGYKRESLARCIHKRMHELPDDTYGGYADHLEARPEEAAKLVNTNLINVASFVRDEGTWDHLR